MVVRVLIADDHRLFAEALEAILSGDDRIELVGLAGDGEEAVRLAGERRPDVILMDISMPLMDGIEAAKAIKAADGDVSILMLTGSNARTDVDRARQAGAAGYVTKDRIAAELVEAISRSQSASYPVRVTSFLAVTQVLLVFVLVSLVLMHSGRDAGMGGLGFTPASQGGTHIVERNLTRLTIVVAVLFFVNSVALFHFLK